MASNVLPFPRERIPRCIELYARIVSMAEKRELEQEDLKWITALMMASLLLQLPEGSPLLDPRGELLQDLGERANRVIAERLLVTDDGDNPTAA